MIIQNKVGLKEENKNYNFYSAITQLVEYLTVNQNIVGSNPTRRANFLIFSLLLYIIMLFIILALLVTLSLYTIFYTRPLELDEVSSEYDYVEDEEYFYGKN